MYDNESFTVNTVKSTTMYKPTERHLKLDKLISTKGLPSGGWCIVKGRKNISPKELSCQCWLVNG